MSKAKKRIAVRLDEQTLKKFSEIQNIFNAETGNTQTETLTKIIEVFHTLFVVESEKDFDSTYLKLINYFENEGDILKTVDSELSKKIESIYLMTALSMNIYLEDFITKFDSKERGTELMERLKFEVGTFGDNGSIVSDTINIYKEMMEHEKDLAIKRKTN